MKTTCCFSILTALACWAGAAWGAPPAPAPTGAPGQEEAVRLISLPRTKAAGPFSLGAARARPKLISAVLVLCPDAGLDVKTLLADPAWQNFAQDHRLGLAAFTPPIEPDPAAKNLPPPSPLSQAALALQALDREFGAGTPLLLYGWPQQTALTESLLNVDPKRVLGWCLHAPERLRDASSAAPPGVVVCYKENKAAYDPLLQDFARGRKLAERLTWIALPGERPTGRQTPALDAFVRDYFAALFNVRLGSEQWQNIDTRQTVGAADLAAHPGTASYLPHASLMAAWMALHVPGGPELARQVIIEREIDTFNPAHPKLHLYLRRPVSAGAAGGKIEGVLAFCTWVKDRKALTDQLQNRDDRLVRYAELHRLALLTWDTDDAYNNDKSADERSRQESFKDDLSFDRLADTWERGVHAICGEAGLPENDFLLYGISRGAQWAHRIALRKPGHFLAVHVHVNSTYDRPSPAAKGVLWLQTTGEREYGYPAALRFYAKCRELGYPILFKAGENLGHSSSGQIDNLGLRFFDYALVVKARRDEWLAGEGRPVRGKAATPDLYALSGLAHTPYCADLINQEVYTADQQDLVPEGQRVSLPTKLLAQAWGEIVEAPAPLLVSNAAAIPPSAGSQDGYFGSPAPTSQPAGQPPNPSASRAAAAAVAAPSGPPGVAADSKGEPAAARGEVVPPNFGEAYQLSVRRTVAQYPQLTQAGSAPNAAFVSEYRRLQAAKSPLLADPAWPERVAQAVREQLVAHPGFQDELRASVRRAVTLYPALAEADSPLNAAFLAEYARLKEAGSPMLADPTWPEQVARTVGEKEGQPLTPTVASPK